MPVNNYDTEKSPCLDCEHQARDKNHDDCMSCDKRVAYMKPDKPLTPNLLKQVRDPISLHHIPETPLKRKPGRPKGPTGTKFKPASPFKIPLSPTEEHDLKKMREVSNIVSDKIGEISTKNDEKAPEPKICSKCQLEKDLEKGFSNNPGSKDGKHSVCRDCRNRNVAKNRRGVIQKILVDLRKYPELYDQISNISKDEVRTVEQQVIFILKDWLKSQEHRV